MATRGKCTTLSSTEVTVKTNRSGLRLIGAGMIVLGLLLVFLAVPFWLWVMLLGIALIAVGFILVLMD